MFRPHFIFFSKHMLGFSCLLATCLFSGCKANNVPTTESEKAAFTKPFVQRFHNIPSTKSKDVLAQLSKRLTHRQNLVPVKGTHFSPSSSLRGAVLHALPETGGLPRSQLEPILETLVAPASKACDGVSCSRLFGMTQKEINDFLNETYDLVAKDQNLLKSDKKALREFLLSCLTKEDPSAQLPLEKRLAQLPKVAIPAYNRPQGSQKIPLDLILKREDVDIIKAYTNYNYRHVRMIQTTPIEKIRSFGFDQSVIEKFQTEARQIDKALLDAPKMPGTVYRGMGGVPREDIERLFSLKDQRSIVVLGQNNLPAITSASWNPNIALHFINNYPTDKYNILYAIKQRRGATIESISKFPGEEEVLLGSSSIFQISAIGSIDPSNRLIFVELIEILRP
jgi:hypothetical protein